MRRFSSHKWNHCNMYQMLYFNIAVSKALRNFSNVTVRQIGMKSFEPCNCSSKLLKQIEILLNILSPNPDTLDWFFKNNEHFKGPLRREEGYLIISHCDMNVTSKRFLWEHEYHIDWFWNTKNILRKWYVIETLWITMLYVCRERILRLFISSRFQKTILRIMEVASIRCVELHSL